jgi:hypothetical protein
MKTEVPTPGKGRKVRRIVSRVLLAVIAAFLIAGVVHFERVKNAYKQEIAEIRKTYDPLIQNAALTEETKKKRVDFYKRRLYIDSPVRYAYAAADFIRKITLIAPKEITFSEIRLQPADQAFTFSLTGRLNADNKTDVHMIFYWFRRYIMRFEEVFRLKPAKKKYETAAGHVELYFTLRGEVQPR